MRFADGGIYNRGEGPAPRRHVLRAGRPHGDPRRQRPVPYSTSTPATSRVLPAHRGHHHHEQRDLPVRPHEPAARRQPHPARGVVAGPVHRPRPSPRHRRARGTSPLCTCAGRPASSATSAAAGSWSSPTWGRAARTCLSSRGSTGSRPDSSPPRGRVTPSPRRSSASRSRTRSRASCRAALNGATIARSQLVRPFPQFGSIVTESTGIGPLPRGHHPGGEALPNGNSLLTTYTRAAARQPDLPESGGAGAGGPRVSGRPAEQRHAGRASACRSEAASAGGGTGRATRPLLAAGG